MYKKIGLAIGLGLGIAAVTPALAEARKFTLSSGFPENAAAPQAYKIVAEWLADKGFDVEVHSMSLLSFTETAAGIRDGIADAGYVISAYSLAEFAETNMAGDMTMLVSSGTDAPGLTMNAAMVEYTLLNCPDCVAEYNELNQLYLSGGASTEYSLICTKPITTVADLKGLSVRTSAAVFGRWVEHFGGTKVSIPGSEMYEALSQKVVDCSMISTPDARNFQLMDVTTDMTVNAPGGVYAAAGSLNVNLDLWRALSEDERATMLEAAALMSAQVSVIYHLQAIEAEEAIRAAGVKIIRASDEIAAATEAFVEQDLKVIEQQFTDLYGVKNAAAKIETVKALVEKWKGLIATIDPTDAEAYRDLLVQEIYSKVDLATYGL